MMKVLGIVAFCRSKLAGEKRTDIVMPHCILNYGRCHAPYFLNSCGAMIVTFMLLACAGPAVAAPPVTRPAANEISLANLPESMELKTLVDYVGQRLDLNLLYDEQLNNQRVTLKAPVAVSREQLLGILSSALRLK